MRENMLSFTAPIVRQLIDNTTFIVLAVDRPRVPPRTVILTLGWRTAKGDKGEIDTLDRLSRDLPQHMFVLRFAPAHLDAT